MSSDGILHVLGLPSGKDIQRPAEFLPANARWSDTIAVNTTLYATTTGNCGGAPNAVWAIDLESEGKPVVSWKSNGGPIVGRLAFATDGTHLRGDRSRHRDRRRQGRTRSWRSIRRPCR